MRGLFSAHRTVTLASGANYGILVRVKVGAMELSNRKFGTFIGRNSAMGGNSGLLRMSVGSVRRGKCSLRAPILMAGTSSCTSIVRVTSNSMGTNTPLLATLGWEKVRA